MPNDDDGQDHMFRFIPLKEVDKSATFGEVATPKVVLHDQARSQSIRKGGYILRGVWGSSPEKFLIQGG